MRLRNREAPAVYAIVGGGLAVALIGGLLTPQRWQVLALIAVCYVVVLRYLVPTSATIDRDGVTFRWPLRTVVLTPANLVTARVLTGGGARAIGLRRSGSVRFGVIVRRYTDPAALAAALESLVRAAPAAS